MAKTKAVGSNPGEFVPLDPLEQMAEKARDLLDELEDALTSVGADQLRVDLIASLPVGDNRIGRVRLLGWDGAAEQLVKTDADGELQIDVVSSANPPNLDVALSTRASESTLASLNGKLPAASALSDALANPTTTLIGGCLLGWDRGAVAWERILTDGGGRLKSKLDELGFTLQADAENRLITRGEPHRITPSATFTGDGTTTSFTATLTTEKAGRKILWLNNAFGVDATVKVEGSVDGTNFYEIRNGISIPAGANRWGVVNEATQSVRVTVTTTTAPAAGTTFDAKIFGMF